MLHARTIPGEDFGAKGARVCLSGAMPAFLLDRLTLAPFPYYKYGYVL